MNSELARFTLRWAVDISVWAPEDPEWQFLLGMLPPEDRQTVQRFKFRDDQKRALVSRLLQLQCVSRALCVPFEAVSIQRTRGKKPFYAGGARHPGAPNFNFNVSHEGDYVVLAAEPVCICGVDVAAPQQVRRSKQEPLESFFASFDRQFTPDEWRAIRGAGLDDESKAAAFRQHWSMKEALVKVRGDGIAFDMGRAAFRISSSGASTTARLWIDDVEQPRCLRGLCSGETCPRLNGRNIWISHHRRSSCFRWPTCCQRG
jgi:4'-phosphopantetheinyl transferase